MLLYPVIVRLRTYDNPLSFTIVLVNSPGPLNTFDDKYTLIPDLPYIVLLGPGVIVRPSNVLTANVTLVIPDPWKAFKPMLVTEDGIVMDVNPVIPWNALDPILVTDDGIVIDFKPVIPWKALVPMLVTDDGISIDVTVNASWKALAPILV